MWRNDEKKIRYFILQPRNNYCFKFYFIKLLYCYYYYCITYLNVSGECGGEYCRDGDDQQQMVHGGKSVWFPPACPAIRGFGTNDSVQMPTTLLYDRHRPSPPPPSNHPSRTTQGWRRHAVAKLRRKDSIQLRCGAKTTT